MLPVELALIDLPEFGVPTVEPTVSGATYANRIAMARERAAAANLDALVIYGDKEQFANLTYLTGYDPRFDGGAPVGGDAHADRGFQRGSSADITRRLVTVSQGPILEDSVLRILCCWAL